MKKRTFIISLIIPLLVGAISAFITNNQMETYSNLNTPLLAPPGWLFPIVWTLLYILMGISIYISHDPKRENALIVYSFQLFINFCWPLFFFNLHNYFLSLMILIALILTVIYMLIIFKKINPKSFYLNIPYILWLFFALYLNFMIFINNLRNSEKAMFIGKIFLFYGIFMVLWLYFILSKDSAAPTFIYEEF